jgi:hypothetical protein
VAAKDSVTNIHKRLKNVYGVNAVDKNTVSLWALRTAGSDKAKAEFIDAFCSGHCVFLGGGCRRGDFCRYCATR